MGLSEQAIQDAAQITSNGDDWGKSISLIAPNGEAATCNGLSRKINYNVNGEGNEVNSKKASVTISESVLLAANPNYPVRVSNPGNKHFGEVDFEGHLITTEDSTGQPKQYIARAWFPDEKLGWTTIILEDYSSQ